jgi:polysaccharide export outer membrane protein
MDRDVNGLVCRKSDTNKVIGLRKIVLFYAVALVMHGCALAPGMKAGETNSATIEPGVTVQVQPITIDLLDRLDDERLSKARQVAREFSVQFEDYRIGPGDVLNITVWDHPELTIPAGQFRDAETSGQLIGNDGYFFYPYVGKLRADGMTVAEIRDILTERLSTYINNPQLDVRVVGFRSQKVYLVGEVNDPGVIPLTDIPMMVADAISLSGGLTENAHKSGVNISRGGKVYEIDLKAMYDQADASQNLMLTNGDIVNVLDRSQQKVFLMGEVKTPKAVEIINGELTLSAALGEVGGVNQNTADPSGIYVIRNSDESVPEIYHLNAGQAFGLLLAERFDMQAQDIVFVDTAGISEWNRVISQLLPSITVLGIANNVAQ